MRTEGRPRFFADLSPDEQARVLARILAASRRPPAAAESPPLLAFALLALAGLSAFLLLRERLTPAGRLGAAALLLVLALGTTHALARVAQVAALAFDATEHVRKEWAVLHGAYAEGSPSPDAESELRHLLRARAEADVTDPRSPLAGVVLAKETRERLVDLLEADLRGAKR